MCILCVRARVCAFARVCLRAYVSVCMTTWCVCVVKLLLLHTDCAALLLGRDLRFLKVLFVFEEKKKKFDSLFFLFIVSSGRKR